MRPSEGSLSPAAPSCSIPPNCPSWFNLADRCLVVYGGRIFAQLSGADINERTLVAALTGYSSQESAA
jgi:ABC-type sugar transport system ATPase subunit